MNTFHLPAEDWAWMRRRLRSTGGIMLLLLGLGVATQFRSPAPNEPGANNTLQPSTIGVGNAPPTEKPGGRSVPPSGWRRTSRGWEHVASWPASGHRSDRPSLGERVRALEASEPVWVRHAFRRLRATPPLMVAFIQVVAIGLICQLGRRGQHSPPAHVPDPDPADRRVAAQVHGGTRRHDSYDRHIRCVPHRLSGPKLLRDQSEN